MSDEHLRSLERAWLRTGGEAEAEAYDRALGRAGEPTLRALALGQLGSMVRAAAFDPSHLVTACCGTPVWWGPTIANRDFTLSRPLYCGACLWTRHGFRPSGYGFRPSGMGRTRHIVTLNIDMHTPFPLHLVPVSKARAGGAIGRLHPHHPAPVPTRLLASVVRHGHEVMGVVTVSAAALLRTPAWASISNRGAEWHHQAGGPPYVINW